VNTLFVLDEPSIGLHPRDVGRIVGVMRRLRDAGNTLVVVEHDPKVMRAADLLLDIGPGPGERGGEIVFYGDFARIRAPRRNRSPRITVSTQAGGGAARPGGRKRQGALRIEGAAEHNLKTSTSTYRCGGSSASPA